MARNFLKHLTTKKVIVSITVPAFVCTLALGALYQVVNASETNGDKVVMTGDDYAVNSLRNSVVLSQIMMNHRFRQSIGGGSMLADDVSLKPLAGAAYGEDVTYRTPQLQPSIYIVQDGDTVSNIAELFNVSVDTIKGSNSIDKALSEGQVLIILPSDGIIHTVKSGETLSEISDDYDVPAGDILAYNKIEADDIRSNEELIIPGGKLQVKVAKKKSSTSASATSSSTGYIRPIKGGRRSQGLHGNNAVDFAAAPGTSILAAASGEVIASKKGGWNGGYGTYIVIAHANGTQTLYAHNSSNIVGVGDRVVQGQVIGYVGSSGRSTGPHVHFELRGATNPF